MNLNRLVARDLLCTSLAIGCIATTAMIVARQHRAPVDNAPPPVAEVGPTRSPVALGTELYEKKGCIVCHTVDGTPRVGPTFLHDYGTTIALADGTTVAMDDAYIAESILSPQAKARPGYPPSMPSYAGLVKPRELAALTAYIRSLR